MWFTLFQRYRSSSTKEWNSSFFLLYEKFQFRYLHFKELGWTFDHIFHSLFYISCLFCAFFFTKSKHSNICCCVCSLKRPFATSTHQQE